MEPGFLKFEECFMERIWGGDQLRRVLGKAVPDGKIIGESWMIADHSEHTSVVKEGPFSGCTLHQLMEKDRIGLLGANAATTGDGRFPLLLKLIDAAEDLSIQVHPDDKLAERLGEPDSGKTEMWHVLGTEGDSRILLGLQAGVTREVLEKCLLEGGDVAGFMHSFPVRGGESFFVAAGTAHAIGGGALLAEIQQNSNITYRLYDYNRRDKNGNLRELHVDKGLSALRFEDEEECPAEPLCLETSGALREFLAACRYFAAEKVFPGGGRLYADRGKSFHILLSLEEIITLEGNGGICSLPRGEAALVPASMPDWQVMGQGAYLDYYVPNLYEDIIVPLRQHGYAGHRIAQLGGNSRENDLATEVATKNMHS